MKRRSKSILAVLSSVAVLLSAQVVMSLGATASNTDTVEAYETKDGDASHLIKDATVKLANGNGPGTAVAGRWQENSDGTLTHKGTHNYDALLYQFGEENLPSAYEIAGKFMVNAVQDGNYELSLVFGTESVEDVMQYQMAMLSNVPYDDAYPGTPKGAYINRFGVGINWNVTSDPRDWSLPGIGQETSFAIKVNGREVELTLGTASYTYQIPAGYEDTRVAWGFYIDGVDVTISDLAYSAAGEEPETYPTKDGDASHLIKDATVKLANGNGPGTAVAGRWQENSDGTLTHKGTHNYDALLYQFGEENLPSAYEIAGKFTVNAVQDGNYELSLVFGTESVEDVMQYQMAMLSNVPYDDAYPGTPKGAYINRFGVGINWNVTSDPRDWSLPGIGQETSFAIKVNGREVELTLGTASYTYTTPEGVEDARVAWGFYIDGVDVTISDLAYSAAGEEPETYPTKDGDASHLIDGATVKLASGNGPGTAVAGRWQENSDGTLTHKGTHNYDALLYQFGEENLPSAYEIAGKFTVNAVQDGNYELSLVFGTESIEDVMQYQMAMLSNVPYDDAYPGTPKGAYINRFGVGINWNVTSDPRDWSLPGIGQETSFAIKVNGREVELTLGTASYTYTTPEGVEDARVAWGFYIDGVDVTISDLAYSAAGEEPETYPTKDGDASHLIDGATVKLASGNGPGTAVAGRWQENSDGTLTHKGTHNYDALLYQFGEENLPSAYEIAGKFTVNAVQDGNYELSLVFGTESIEDVMQYQMAMLSNVPYDDAYPGTPKGAYINRFGVGINWNVTSDPRDWSLPGIGQETSFAIKVNGREVELTLGTASYTYQIPAGYEDARVAWGFYIDGVDVTISDLAYSAAGEEPDAYPTKDGDASHLIDGATVQLANGNGPSAVIPGRWLENTNGTLTHKGTGNYDAIVYQFGDEKLPNSYEIAGKFTVNAVQDGNRQFSLVFGTESVDDVSQYQMAMLSNVSFDSVSDYSDPATNYINRFNVGIGWNTSSVNKDWALSEIGKETTFILRVNGRNVELVLDGETYAYQTPEGVEDARVAWGFYIDGVDVTISDLYYGDIRPDENFYATEDGDESNLFDGSTIRLDNLGENMDPVVGAWKEGKNGTLVHRGNGSKYNAILYEYEEYMPTSYEISGTMTIDKVDGMASRFAIIFGSSEFDDDFWQAAQMAPRNSEGKPYNDNYTNGYLAAGIGWVPKANPGEAQWTLPEEGKTVKFVLIADNRTITLSLDGVAYASYYIDDAHDFTAINRYYGFYSDGVDITLSDLYYGPIKTKLPEPTTPSEEDEGTVITRAPEEGESNGGEEDIPSTGESSLLAVIALLGAVLSLAAVLLIKTQKALGMKE